jgi:phenylalanyl-tRNA synthetase beta chain
MKAPILWLEDYVKINTPIKQLMWNLTEIGLTCESYETVDNKPVLDIEVTPNRPDWLSITGIAREIAFLEDSEMALPSSKKLTNLDGSLPIEVSLDPKLASAYAGVTISDITIEPSPLWLQERLKLVGLRPINNIVDITNFVMFELGIPTHAFDYDKFLTKRLKMTLSTGGEDFESVDNISYKLPKDAIIIKDKNRVIDLCGIKGGANTGISQTTKNIFIHVPVYHPVLIRKTSQTLKLSSDASYIYERSPSVFLVDKVLTRVTDLVSQYAGGKPSCLVNYPPKTLKQKREVNIDLDDLNNFLGTEILANELIKMLKRIGFATTISGKKIKCQIPDHRCDINIKEDLYEEIARLYRYNSFSKTLPGGNATQYQIPYSYDREFEILLKNMLSSAGFFEINSSALTSKDTIIKANLNLEIHIRIANPASLEYEYMRTSLLPSLISAVRANTNAQELRLFEFAKIYLGPVDEAKEIYKLSAVSCDLDFRELKGVIDFLLDRLNINDIEIKPVITKRGIWHPTRAGIIEKGDLEIGIFGELHPEVLRNFSIKKDLLAFELDIRSLKKLVSPSIFKPLPKYPPQIEDITLTIRENTQLGKIIKTIKEVEMVNNVYLVDTFGNFVTLRLYYSHPQKTLSDQEVEKIRKQVLKEIEEKFQAAVKS